ncbi:MAG: hypothetical protein NW241_22655 [Bacteroidia bacterium]|nr:hypothetical protein [Bacteroidia bacterium]
MIQRLTAWLLQLWEQIRLRMHFPDQDWLFLRRRILAFALDAAVMLGINLVLPILGFAPAMAYLLMRDSLPWKFLRGRSLGKRLMRLDACGAGGQDLILNWPAAMNRNALLLFPPFWLVELYVLLRRGDGQRLGDRWAGTFVRPSDPVSSSIPSTP